MTESTLDSLLKAVNYINLDGGRDENESDFQILKHIQYLVKKHLLGSLHVVVYIFQYEKHTDIGVIFKVLVDLLHHFQGVEGLSCVL